IDQERRVAVYELLEENRFRPSGAGEGPFEATLRVADNRIRIEARPANGGAPLVVDAPLGSLKPIVGDYRAICDSYYAAVRNLPPSQIEALDQTRREVHQEGAAALRKRLSEQASMDEDAARRLFTLVCALMGAPSGAG
ncbi:MAG: UPF0262 family protein, partial [Pseudomonadota bacterium]